MKTRLLEKFVFLSSIIVFNMMKLLVILFIIFLSKLSQATAQKLSQFYLDVMFWATQVNNVAPRFIGCLFLRIIGLVRFMESILVNNLFCKIILAKCIGVLINYLSLIFWLLHNYHQTNKVYKYHTIKKIFLSAYK